MNFSVLGASETREMYRDFFMLNYPDKFQHLFACLEDQLADRGCLLCGDECSGPTWDEQHVDFMVLGSPCDPFSVQRSKRYSAGNVKAHSDFATTMEGVVEGFAKFNPTVAIMEQVQGFAKPFEAGGTETPYQRQGNCFGCLG